MVGGGQLLPASNHDVYAFLAWRLPSRRYLTPPVSPTVPHLACERMAGRRHAHPMLVGPRLSSELAIEHCQGQMTQITKSIVFGIK